MGNSYQPGFNDAAGTYSPDILIGGSAVNAVTESIIIDTGNLVRGTLLGKITEGARTAVGAADVPAPAGATITASPTATTAAKVGIHRFVCITAGATGKFRHYDPDGQVVGDATTGTEYTGGGLTLTITDSGTDPDVGEALKVTVTAAAGSGKYIKSLAAATDGSEVPCAILAEDADATSGDVTTIAYVTGEFNSDAMTFGAGHDADSVAAGLREKGIFLKTNLAF